MDLGTRGWCGRWFGVNWVGAVWLTIYHAVVSIAIPIFLVEWIWPRTRGLPLTSRRGYITAIALLAGATVFINILLTPYRPSFWHLLGAAAAVAFLAWAAKKYAGPLWARLPARRLPRSPRVYALAGFGFLMGLFLLYGGGPSFGIIPSITILEGAAVLAAVMLLVRRTSDDPARWARQRFAFVAGAMGFLIVLAASLEIPRWRRMAIVGAAFAILLARLYRKSSPTTEVSPVVPPGPAAPQCAGKPLISRAAVRPAGPRGAAVPRRGGNGHRGRDRGQAGRRAPPDHRPPSRVRGALHALPPRRYRRREGAAPRVARTGLRPAPQGPDGHPGRL